MPEKSACACLISDSWISRSDLNGLYGMKSERGTTVLIPLAVG